MPVCPNCGHDPDAPHRTLTLDFDAGEYRRVAGWLRILGHEWRLATVEQLVAEAIKRAARDP